MCGFRSERCHFILSHLVDLYEIVLIRARDLYRCIYILLHSVFLESEIWGRNALVRDT